MRCACRGEVSKSARLKWSPTVARRDFLTLAQRFRDNMKGNFQFVFHPNSASPNFDRSDSVVALEEWQFAVGGQISSDHAQLHGDHHPFFNTMQPQRALDFQLRHTFLLRHGANSRRSELDLRVSGRVQHLVPEHGRLNLVAILFRFTRIDHYKRRGCRDKGDGRFGDVRLCELHLAGQLCRRNDVVVAKAFRKPSRYTWISNLLCFLSRVYGVRFPDLARHKTPDTKTTRRVAAIFFMVPSLRHAKPTHESLRPGGRFRAGRKLDGTHEATKRSKIPA